MGHAPFAIFVLVCVVLIVIPFWRIFRKAGFTPWLALFMCVPFLNILMMWFLAFVPWRQPKHPST